jgi:hypothetical protein
MRKTLSTLSCLSVVVVIAMVGCTTSHTRKNVDRAKYELKTELKPELKRELVWELHRDMQLEMTNKIKPELKTELKPALKSELKNELKNELADELRTELKGELLIQLRSEMSSMPRNGSTSTSTSESTGSTSTSPTTTDNNTTETASAEPGNVVLFNGKTLEGWIPYQGNLGQFSGADFVDFTSFAKKMLNPADSISSFINQHLDDTVKTSLASYSADAENAKAVKTAFVRNMTKIVSAKKSIYDRDLFKDVQLRPETEELLKNKKLKGQDLARLNKMLIEDAYPKELARSSSVAWVVKGDALASTGEGRGLIYTKDDYSHFRLTFLIRHITGNPDHQASILIFCSRPADGEKPVDALAGIQFQMPNGGHWDYRAGHNEAGKGEFKTIAKTEYNAREWSQVEIVANAATGIARMAVAQPPGSRAMEVTDFADATAGKAGPIALQMHNGGLLDEYKNFKIEVNPKSDDLVTTVMTSPSESSQTAAAAQ